VLHYTENRKKLLSKPKDSGVSVASAAGTFTIKEIV
jgi:hypothetical protein